MNGVNGVNGTEARPCETVKPEWDETFTFNLGACPDEVEDDITVCLYDYDLALNDFLAGAWYKE